MTDRPIEALAAMAASLDQAQKDAVKRLGDALLAEASAVLPGIGLSALTPGGAQMVWMYSTDRYSGALTIGWDAKGWRGGIDAPCGHWTSPHPTAREAVHALLTALGSKALNHLYQPVRSAGLEWRLVPITPKEPT